MDALTLAYELAHKAMLEGWDIKIDMNKGTVEHNIHCKPNNWKDYEAPSVILPHSVEPTTQVLEAE